MERTAGPMDTYELRSEILSGGNKYYIQSNLVPSQRLVVASLFHEGILLSKQEERYDSSISAEEARALVRRVHDERRARLASLLEIRESLKKDVDPRAHLKLADALHKQKLFKEAMAEAVRAVKLGLEEATAYAILGNCLLALGDVQKAVKAFRKGIEIAPEYPDLHNDLGRALLEMERCREAVTSFERALELNKYYQAALTNLAIALAANVALKQDYELSRDLRSRMKRLLQMNLQLRPSLDTEEYRGILTAADAERYDVVQEKLTAVRDEQERIAISDLSLELYLILKFRSDRLTEEDIDGFIDRVGRALDANPGYADLQNDLGLLYTAKCKLLIDRAHDCFRGALEINPEFKKAEKNLKLSANDRQGIHFLLRALLD